MYDYKTQSSSQAMVVHAFNPHTQEAEAGGSLWVWGQPVLQELVPEQEPKATEKPCLENQKKKVTRYTRWVCADLH